VLFNPPVLNLFGGTVFGWPTLYVYLFGVWALIILCIAIIAERGGGTTDTSGLGR
jgi:hypothetical protein